MLGLFFDLEGPKSGNNGHGLLLVQCVDKGAPQGFLAHSWLSGDEQDMTLPCAFHVGIELRHAF